MGKISVTKTNIKLFEQFNLLGYDAVKSIASRPTFRRNMSLLAAYFMLVFCMAYSSALKMETA
jgi:hypothetical protein